jgi:tetratricopeptide (TPR) repeat protein
VTRAWTGGDTGIATGVGVVCLVALWFALLPMRANAAVRSGDLALAQGNGNAALGSFEKANRLMPGIGVYWEKTGSLWERVQQPDRAFAAYRTGAEHDPFDISLLMAAARLAGPQRDEALQGRLLRRAVELDPTNPVTVVQAAAYDAGHGRLARALAEVERALPANPTSADLWTAAGQVRASSGDAAGARTAYQRALAIEPGNAVSQRGLAALDKG